MNKKIKQLKNVEEIDSTPEVTIDSHYWQPKPKKIRLPDMATRGGRGRGGPPMPGSSRPVFKPATPAGRGRGMPPGSARGGGQQRPQRPQATPKPASSNPFGAPVAQPVEEPTQQEEVVQAPVE